MAENDNLPKTDEEERGIFINGIKYSYLITKSEKEKKSLIVKLYDAKNNQKNNFTYEATVQKIIKDIKFLSLCDNLDEMIISLNNAFSLGNAKVEENHGNYYLELTFIANKISKKSLIPLTKHDLEKPKYELENKIDKLENKYNELLNKFEELKIIKEDYLRKTVKEIIFDKDTKMKLFIQIENFLSSKYNLNKISKDKKMEDNIINEIQNIVNNNELKENINNEIINIQKQINDNIQYLNNIKLNNNNYIMIQVKIDKNDLNKDIRLFNQVSTYKYYCNFERDDIEVIIDDQIVPVKFKNKNNDFKFDKKLKNCGKSQELEHNLKENYYYYWNFSDKGIHIVKVIFKKKLLKCNDLFSQCKNLFKIDCSNFDCSQINNCSYMFSCCYSLTEINLGKLDFALSNDFSGMFNFCQNLEKLDVSYLNTQNSKTFENMFYGCIKLKEINLSKFKTTNCENINQMLFNCKSLESIDMLKWDMKNINNIAGLFMECSNLKNIKMNFNNDKVECSIYLYIFHGLPERGSFIWKKGINCNRLLELLPASWNRTQV